MENVRKEIRDSIPSPTFEIDMRWIKINSSTRAKLGAMDVVNTETGKVILIECGDDSMLKKKDKSTKKTIYTELDPEGKVIKCLEKFLLFKILKEILKKIKTIGIIVIDRCGSGNKWIAKFLLDHFIHTLLQYCLWHFLKNKTLLAKWNKFIETKAITLNDNADLSPFKHCPSCDKGKNYSETTWYENKKKKMF